MPRPAVCETRRPGRGRPGARRPGCRASGCASIRSPSGALAAAAGVVSQLAGSRVPTARVLCRVRVRVARSVGDGCRGPRFVRHAGLRAAGLGAATRVSRVRVCVHAVAAWCACGRCGAVSQLAGSRVPTARVLCRVRVRVARSVGDGCRGPRFVRHAGLRAAGLGAATRVSRVRVCVHAVAAWCACGRCGAVSQLAGSRVPTARVLCRVRVRVARSVGDGCRGPRFVRHAGLRAAGLGAATRVSRVRVCVHAVAAWCACGRCGAVSQLAGSRVPTARVLCRVRVRVARSVGDGCRGPRFVRHAGMVGAGLGGAGPVRGDQGGSPNPLRRTAEVRARGRTGRRARA